MKTWFKFYGSEFISDPKMDLLTASEISILLTLMCLASMSEEEGVIKYCTPQSILKKSRLNDNEMLSNRFFLDKFKKLKIIKVDNENDEIVITLLNFVKRNTAPMTDYERLKNYRERKKLEKQPQMITNDNGKKRIEENRRDKNNDPPDRRSFKKEDFEEKRQKALKQLDSSNDDDEFDKVFNNPQDQATNVKSKEIERQLNPTKFSSVVLIMLFFFSSIFSKVNAATINLTYSIKSTGSYQLHPNTKKTINHSITTSNHSISTSGGIENKILKVFGKNGRTAVAISKAESGLRPNAKGWNCMYNGISRACKPEDRDNAWSVDCGVFQLNVLGKTCPSEYLDPDWNIQKAYEWKFLPHGFYPWTVYQTGSYLRFL